MSLAINCISASAASKERMSGTVRLSPALRPRGRKRWGSFPIDCGFGSTAIERRGINGDGLALHSCALPCFADSVTTAGSTFNSNHRRRQSVLPPEGSTRDWPGLLPRLGMNVHNDSKSSPALANGDSRRDAGPGRVRPPPKVGRLERHVSTTLRALVFCHYRASTAKGFHWLFPND